MRAQTQTCKHAHEHARAREGSLAIIPWSKCARIQASKAERNSVHKHAIKQASKLASQQAGKR
eukprot:13642816-Alexandrium_andersonii.AAC.1